METAKKQDFVEIQFIGIADGKVFDTNIEPELHKINPKAKAEKIVVAIGEGMLVPGFDKALEGKEIGKDYEITIGTKDAFGERKKELVKTIPLKVFREQNLDPKPGMIFSLDYSLARVITVSGARVVTDFNNPLAGRDITYKFKIIRQVTDEKGKSEALFLFYFKTIPEYEIKDQVIVKGIKQLEVLINVYKEKFKEILGKELSFELKEKKDEKKNENIENEKKLAT